MPPVKIGHNSLAKFISKIIECLYQSVVISNAKYEYSDVNIYMVFINKFMKQRLTKKMNLNLLMEIFFF